MKQAKIAASKSLSLGPPRSSHARTPNNSHQIRESGFDGGLREHGERTPPTELERGRLKERLD
jgi:hypothetical protein